MFDLSTIRQAVTVGAGIADFVGRLVTDIGAVQHSPAEIGTLLSDLSDGLPQIIDAVRLGTGAEHEDNPEAAGEAGHGLGEGDEPQPATA